MRRALRRTVLESLRFAPPTTDAQLPTLPAPLGFHPSFSHGALRGIIPP